MTSTSSAARRRLPSLVAAAVVAVGLAVPAAGAQAATDTATMVKFFSDIVFGTDRQGRDPGTLYVKKWQQSLRIFLTSVDGKLVTKDDGNRELQLSHGRPSKDQVKIIEDHLRTVTQLAGVKIESPKKTGKDVNVQIKLVPRLAMGAAFIEKSVDPKILRALAQPGRCYFLSWASKEGKIVRALMVVNNELPAKEFSACVLRDMAQMMGLSGNSDRITPSVFNPGSDLQKLQPVDRLLLKALYDKRIPAGSSPKEAEAAAAQVLPELARGKP